MSFPLSDLSHCHFRQIKEGGGMCKSQIGSQGWSAVDIFFLLLECQVQLVDAWKERRCSHTEGHASQHPSLSLFPSRRPRARASGCVAMTTKWGKWLQENPHHDHHPHRPPFFFRRCTKCSMWNSTTHFIPPSAVTMLFWKMQISPRMIYFLIVLWYLLWLCFNSSRHHILWRFRFL